MTSAQQKLHDATLTLLERTGVRVESKDALDLSAAHGVRVDFAARRIFPDAAEVDQALRTAPRAFAAYGRRTEAPLVLGGDSTYVLSGGAALRVLTLDGHYETACWEHLCQFNILLDALPNVHMLLNQVDPQDSRPEGYYTRIAAEMLTGSPKPCCLQAADGADVEVLVELGAVLRGSRQALAEKPVFMTGSNAEPPLCIPEHAAGILMAASRAAIPCGVGDYVMMGITAPATVAGAVAQRHAVQLTALILSQLARPGAPFYYCAGSGSADRRTLNPITANPAALMLLRTAAALGRACGLPVVGAAPTDAKTPDAQAACERAAIFLAGMEAGASLIQGPTAMMDQMMLASFVQAVIDNEIIGYLLAAHRPLDLSDEALALDTIHETVSDPALSGLKFAAQPHTAKHWPALEWRSSLFAYESFADSQRQGKPTLVERAAAAAHSILAEHQPAPLAPDIAKEIRRIAGAYPSYLINSTAT
ncbi:MAG: trimethylamine methyltransferase family protein [Lentisphaerae bacterium]|nr:trimethylamine methyltransferase family protein [Lentisphaerota bacterium]